MSAKSYLVTGGSGFMGAALTRRLVQAGLRVCVLDDNSRGSLRRLADVESDLEFIQGDIRDAEAVATASRGMDGVFHLAFVNGTEFFYSRPELVLEVGIKGMTNVLDACLKHNIGELILASSAEVYQTPPQVPTPEEVPLSVPDVLNPRYSYGAGKLISEVMTLNFGRKHFERVAIFRPHNIYGPDMGWEHVIPQIVLRVRSLLKANPEGPLQLPIQGDGKQTRAFCFIEDLVDGLMVLRERGEHMGIYHIGTMEEVPISRVAELAGTYFHRDVHIIPSEAPLGGTLRRCPDITKMRALGYEPRVSLAEGLSTTAKWYDEHAHMAPKVD
jgi:nucleoside-diphosphate-sugar epimerase